MTCRHDWIAVGPRGVYALLDADLASPADVFDFREQASRRGHDTELVTVDEAVRRHREFLELCRWSQPAPAWDLPSFLPSPAQIEMFGEGRP